MWDSIFWGQGGAFALLEMTFQLSERAALLFRQYVKDSLYDRISTRPFLNAMEKTWLAFQLLCALNQCHKLSVSGVECSLVCRYFKLCLFCFSRQTCTLQNNCTCLTARWCSVLDKPWPKPWHTGWFCFIEAHIIYIHKYIQYNLWDVTYPSSQEEGCTSTVAITLQH